MLVDADTYMDRRRHLVDIIRSNPRRFDMGTFGYFGGAECGSTHCIAGWANVLSEKVEFSTKSGSFVYPTDHHDDPPYRFLFSNAKEWLGLGYDDARDLFYNYEDDFDAVAAGERLMSLPVLAYEE